MKDSGGGFLKVFFFVVVIAVIAFRGACADPERAAKHLQTLGFTDTEVTNHAYMFVSFRGCGTDAAMVEVAATNPNKQRVQVNVCLGWPLKGATVRGN